ncbi:MAG: hypothetical protein IT223_03800, partial [Crocinitomicaceae bacterium]|nr:hypothetical protein [Crocinitomicaceae bacterium]
MISKIHLLRKGFFATLLIIALISCKKDEETITPAHHTPSYQIPVTYNFASVDFSASTKRIAMLGELTTYIRTTHSETQAPVLDAQVLKNMYSNTGNPFTDGALNSSGLQLKDQTSTNFGLPAALESNFE